MGRRFNRRIPDYPLFKRETYDVPKEYIARYEKAKVPFRDAWVVLFHLTQFGGFRLGRRQDPERILGESTKKWYSCKQDGRGFSFKASPDFIDEFGDMKLRPLERIWRNGCVKRKEMLECGHSEAEIEQMEAFLKQLNGFYSSVRVGIEIPDSGVNAEDRALITRFHSIPFLVAKPRAGCRFFHPGVSYQRIGSSLRHLLTINGRATSEVDISAATLQFLNIALEKKNIGSIRESILSYADPYQYFLSTLNSPSNLARDGWKRIDREGVKCLVYTAIYSDAQDQSANLSYKLRAMNRRETASQFVNLFPELFEALSALRSSTPIPMHRIITQEESRYAKTILEEGCLERGIPILPLHDSFIAPRSKIKNLQNIMQNAANKMYGRPLVYKRKF